MDTIMDNFSVAIVQSSKLRRNITEKFKDGTEKCRKAKAIVFLARLAFHPLVLTRSTPRQTCIPSVATGYAE
jgi:hypothetical protein